jgi:hypothetical protein
MELIILNKLGFDTMTYTAVYFLQIYTRVEEIEPNVIHLANYMIELALFDFSMLNIDQNLQAATALFVANRFYNRKYIQSNDLHIAT